MHTPVDTSALHSLDSAQTYHSGFQKLYSVVVSSNCPTHKTYRLLLVIPLNSIITICTFRGWGIIKHRLFRRYSTSIKQSYQLRHCRRFWHNPSESLLFISRSHHPPLETRLLASTLNTRLKTTLWTAMHQRSSPATNDPKCTDTRKTFSFLPRASRAFNALQNRCFRSYRFLSFNTNASRCAVYTRRLRRTNTVAHALLVYLKAHRCCSLRVRRRSSEIRH